MAMKRFAACAVTFHCLFDKGLAHMQDVPVEHMKMGEPV